MAGNNNGTVSLSSPTLPGTPSIPVSSLPAASSSNLVPSSSSPPPASTSNAPSPSTNVLTTPQPTTAVVTSVITRSGTNNPTATTVIVSITTAGATIMPSIPPSSASTLSATVSTSESAISPSSTGTSPASQTSPGVVAAAVVVPVVAVALLILASLFFWKKRKQRQGEEARKKEMEEYSFNPNNDPTIPPVGSTSSDGAEPVGYRGWGTTTSNTRKASTTLSNGMARSDDGGNPHLGQYSPTGPSSENQSGDPLVDQNGAHAEPVGALGAAPVAANKGNGVNRGPSNASSAYSGGANRSDTSGEGPSPMNVGSPQYYNDLMYQDNGAPHDHVDGSWAGQPVIKDVSARRNTRIENPSVFPQQGNSGISQNF